MEAKYIAATAEEAIAKGLGELGMSRDMVDIEVVDAGSKGFLGIGGRPATVRMTVREDALRAQMQKEDEERAEKAAAEEAAAKAAAEAEKAKAEKAAKAKAAEVKKAEKAAKPEKKAEPKPEKKAEPKPVKPAEEPEQEGEKTSVDVLTDETVEIASHVVRDLLEKMRVKAEINVKITDAADPVDSRVILVDIQGDDLSFLIGRHSEVLHSLQYIASLIAGREVGHWVPLVIDVQGYRERRERQLRQMATRMADQVVKTGRRISLEPMPATERRIIHLALRENEYVLTESIGDEPNRKVVIFPKTK